MLFCCLVVGVVVVVGLVAAFVVVAGNVAAVVVSGHVVAALGEAELAVVVVVSILFVPFGVGFVESAVVFSVVFR